MRKYMTILALLGIITIAGCTCNKEDTIHFAFDSYQLTSDDKAELDNIVNTLNRSKDNKVEILGYTDATGDKDYNLGLSKQRAISAAGYLEGKGIDRSRITLGAFGKKYPVASNKTAEGRQENRRVEIRVYN
ncbi:MAG: OmpA family protein [Lactobacillus sp.]|jgi:OOP family OmpA-OmpF porin|nr:OmpA family protein [Lactobacillus sp.]